MPIPLRADFDAPLGRAAAKRSKGGQQARRLPALVAIHDGASRGEAAKIGSVTVQIIRDWVVKFNALGPVGLIDRKAPGQPSRLTGKHRQALAGIIESGPMPVQEGHRARAPQTSGRIRLSHMKPAVASVNVVSFRVWHRAAQAASAR